MTTTTHTIRVFKRFERIEHWCQMALIFTLIFCGFAVHGFYPVISFGDAFTLHTWGGAILLLILWAFAIFWLFTTGHSFIDHVKPMITGYDEVDLTLEKLAYWRSSEPVVLK